MSVRTEKDGERLTSWIGHRPFARRLRLYDAPLDILPQNILPFIAILIPLVIWGYIWKFIGLWFSAKNGEKAWFIIFALVNLAGILELYYLHSRKCWPFKPNQ